MRDLDQLIIELHDLARQVAEKVGQSDKLSEDIRACADQLTLVIKHMKSKGEY